MPGPFGDERRPRAMIWSFVALLALAGVMVAALVFATSTKWFCAAPCHMVQSDTIASYDASTHSKVSCITCHEPVGAGPHILLMLKAKSGLEVIPTVLGTYELPLNAGSAYGLGEEMPDEQCTQCHGTNRKVTPSDGVIINHAVHAKNDVTCVSCHNRIAHDESKLTLKLEGNEKHADFEEMDGCFRCHDVEGKKRATGECSACHPKGFDLVPATHKAEGWLPEGHAEAATESLKEFGRAERESERLKLEGISEDLARPVEYCSTCHPRSFCKDCHEKLGKALTQKNK